ncbi:MAG: pdxK [Bacillales bacterium]|jgi:pyridoxine kinase|nr:pdxK [Bacillales bacterium]
MQKRVLAIHDLSGYGKCSLTVAIPIISVLSAEVCPLPTAILSAHTGIEDFVIVDLTDRLNEFVQHYHKLNIHFDAIFSGFLASSEQVDIVQEIFSKLGNNALKIVDPVMGDMGEMYSTYTPELCHKMKDLVRIADVVTPNLTELCLLLDREYPKDISFLSISWIYEYMKEIADMGPKHVVVTGIRLQDYVVTIGYDKLRNSFFEVKTPYVDMEISGAGDMFASVVCGYLLQGVSFQTATELAANFVHKCVAYTKGANASNIIFEPLLKELLI